MNTETVRPILKGNTGSGAINLLMAASSGFTTRSSLVCSQAVATVR